MSVLVSGRFRLIIGSLPVVVAVLAARFLLHETWEIGEVASFGEIGSVITGVSLILGFMLAGVLTDYKKSERLPALVAGALLGVANTLTSALEVKDLESGEARHRVASFSETVVDWLHGRVDDAVMWAAHADISRAVTDAERRGIGTHYVGRLLAVNGELTATLNRIAVIRNTSFIQSGYVLMTFLVAVLQLSLVVVSFPSTVMSWLAPAVLSLAYAYLLLLVRDLDNPFGHGENGGAGSGADVDLSPVTNVAHVLTHA